jgi:hypothetical protein
MFFPPRSAAKRFKKGSSTQGEIRLTMFNSIDTGDHFLGHVSMLLWLIWVSAAENMYRLGHVFELKELSLCNNSPQLC